jgi:hypothetical protein
MNKINSKIYYEKTNGNVLIITSECQGCVEPTTKEEDIQIYDQLKNKNIDDVDYIELEYGTLSKTFSNSKEYKINIDTKKLEITYYTQQEENEINRKNIEEQNILDRINLISQYSNLDKTSIADLEYYILQREKNRIIGGVK